MIGFGEECVMCFILLSSVIILGFLYLAYKAYSSHAAGAASSSQSISNNRIRSEEVDCAICLENVSFAVETNCGHVYCGACLLEYIDRSASLSTPTCPYCRQRITMILLYFTSEESQNNLPEPQSKRREALIEKIKSYNRSYSNGPRSALEHIRDFPVLAQRLWNMFWNSPDSHTLFFRLRLIALSILGLIYFLSPFDLIPEFLLGVFGLLDDVFIILSGCFYAVHLYRNLVALQGL